MTAANTKEFRRTTDEAAHRGHPSYVWRAGQERRLALVRQWAKLDGAAILDAGCGVGMYTEQFRRFSPRVTGVEVDPAVAGQAAARLPGIVLAPAEALPFADGSFDVVFSHEVIEHVTDDAAAAAEMARVLAPGGRIVMFCPNRLYPFETHGHYWRGTYHFGNTPLINWLPDPLRDRLAPHVRAYTGAGCATSSGISRWRSSTTAWSTPASTTWSPAIVPRAASCGKGCTRWSTRRCSGSD